MRALVNRPARVIACRRRRRARPIEPRPPRAVGAFASSGRKMKYYGLAGIYRLDNGNRPPVEARMLRLPDKEK